MWFLTLVLGALLGGAIGGSAGAFIGAICGAAAGWALMQKRAAAHDERLKAIEQSVRVLMERIDTLERRQSSQPQRAEAVAGENAATFSSSAAAATSASHTAPQAPVGLPTAQAPATTPDPIPEALSMSLPPAASPAIFTRPDDRAVLDEALAAIVPRERQEASPAPAPPPAEVAPLTAEAAAAQYAADSAEPAVEIRSSFFQRLVGGNIVAKLGVLILFIGVGFLLKYAYDQGRLPVQVRLAAVAVVACAMLYGGWRLLSRRRLYGLILQGCGIGLLYLDVFFALRVYGLVEPMTGFAAFMALGVAATLLAVRQDAKVLAVLGLTGAFIAPILAGSRSGNHVLLFSYYTLLNSLILTISWFKAWRDLNLVGFIFTFAVGAVWGASNYRPELFATVEPFVLLFFVMYLVIPILFAQRQPPELKGLVDATLVFGTPLCVAFMQAGLVKDIPYGLAWSAGIASGLYAALAAITIRRDRMRLLAETYIALAVLFLTLAIFFAFGAYPTFALWTLEGAAIFWVGMRQRRVLARVFGLALQFAGTAYFLLEYPRYELSSAWWNEFVLGCAIIAAAGFIIAWLLNHYGDRRSTFEPSDNGVLVWASAWWCIGGTHALYRAYPWTEFAIALLAFVAVTVAAVELIGSRLQWSALRKLVRAHLPALVAIALLIGLQDRGRLEFARPLAHGGFWGWPVNFALFFWVYARQSRDGLIGERDATHGLAWLLVAAIATWDAAWLLDRNLNGQAMVWGAAGVVAACMRYRLRERDIQDAVPMALPALVWGLAFWFIGGVRLIDLGLMATKPAALLAFVALSSIAFEIIGRFVPWNALRRAAIAILPGLAIVFVLQLARGTHPALGYGWLAWPFAIGVLYGILRRHERDAIAPLPHAQHIAGLWLTLAVLVWEAGWQLDAFNFGKPWVSACYGLLPAAAIAGIASFNGKAAWPFGARYVSVYRDRALGGLVVYLALWTIYANISAPGDMRPLVYVPLLNPLDVATAAAILSAWRWSRTLEVTDGETRRTMLGLFVATGFLWVNCVMLRSIHYWTGVEYELAALSASVLVQSGFSLLWTASAFVLMKYATRENRRQLWMIGAALIGVVVLKLFLNDLSSTGTVARIVSFIGVGAGLLLIGYVAPVPPGDTEQGS